MTASTTPDSLGADDLAEVEPTTQSKAVEVQLLTTDDQVRTAFGVFSRAMLGLDFSGVDAAKITEPGRYLGAFTPTATSGPQLVGSADSYSGTLAVPGGALLPHAAVTHIGVLPTHRRRGVLTELIRYQLADLAARGDAVATLRASDAQIYGRFGYGIASHSHSVTVDRHRTGLRQELTSNGTIRLVEAVSETTSDLLAGIYARLVRPGTVTRPPGWWLGQRLRASTDKAPQYTVVHSTGGVDDGYLTYRPLDSATWFTSRNKSITVTDFVALSASAQVGLWRHLFALDLVDAIRVESLAIDDPLPLFLTDPRAAEFGPTRDETWLRLIDVEAALRARTFRSGSAVTLTVIDEQLPANTGNYLIDSTGARRLSDDNPTAASDSAATDITVTVADIAAAFLGGTAWHLLATAGRLQIRRAEAITDLDLLFGTDRAPFSGTVF